LVTSPHQDAILLIYSQLFGVDEFVFDPLDVVVIDVETQFESPIGHPPFTLEESEDLGENFIEGHTCPFAVWAFPLGSRQR
jgi:hypothetical protein